VPTSDNPKPGHAVQPAKPVRRAVSASDYRMPKPYRKPVYVDETQRRMSPRQVLMFTASATLIAGLIFTLALLARSHSGSASAMQAAAAPAPEIAPVAAPRRAQRARPAVRRWVAVPVAPGALANEVADQVADMPTAGISPGAYWLPDEAAAPGRAVKPGPPVAASAPGPAMPPDPDVDLIAVILTLFPQPASSARAPATPVCVAPAEQDDGCEQLQMMQR
jgi:hypothetical protein